MSKIDKDLGLEDMLGMIDADRTVVPKQVASTSSQKKSTPSDTVANKESANSTLPKEENTVAKVKVQEESKTDNKNSPKKAKIVATSPKKIKTSGEFIFTLLKNFSKTFTRGESFTSVRILKEKVKYLKLLFPGQSIIEIIDTLITECLIKNRAKLKERRKAFYDAKL